MSEFCLSSFLSVCMPFCSVFCYSCVQQVSLSFLFRSIGLDLAVDYNVPWWFPAPLMITTIGVVFTIYYFIVVAVPMKN
eukprot:m.220288 g.220288  ORF g.220288 m.220288 type:complete len:79 (-) comp13829_c6_seq3:383-619(-)